MVVIDMEYKIINNIVYMDVNGKTVLLSEVDKDLANMEWRLETEQTSNGVRYYVKYAHSKGSIHRVVMRRVLKEKGMELKKEVDHIDRNPLNNKRDNLRESTKTQNNCNKGKIKMINGKKTSSQCIGVTYDKKAGKWRSRLKHDGIVENLGYHNSEESAAMAYDNAAKKYHGEFASLNFPR
ncbi:MAG: HNH endonuclease [Methanothrix sp.]